MKFDILKSPQAIYKLFGYIKPHKFTFLTGLFFLLLSSIASLLFPWLVGELVDQANQDISSINKIATLLLILFGAQAIFSYFRIVLFVNVTAKAMAKLRSDSFSNLIKLPVEFFSNRRIGELCSRIASDIEILKNTFTTDFAEFLRQIIMIIGGIALLSITSFKLTLFMLCTLPVIVIIAVIFGRKLRKYAKDVQNIVAESNTIVEETLQAISTIKSFTSELSEIKRYGKKAEAIADMSIKLGKLRAIFASFIIFGIFGSIVAVIWYGTILIQQDNMSIGQLFSFVLYSVFIAASVGGIAELYASIQKAIGATDELLKLQNESPEEISEENTGTSITGNIYFNQVDFSYPSRKNTKVINNLSFEINEGEQVAIVGLSGSGKTTITKLLLRLYDIDNGSITFDKQKIENFSLHELRKQIGIVPQDIVLFATTIKENLLYANKTASEQDIIEAAKKANAHDFIMQFDDGYETVVGERGVEISGGQRQRIAIARAILKNPKILIFDEATSSLDSKSEQLIQESIDLLLKSRTSIIISHRLSTIKNADKIFVIEEGKLIQSGTHEQLMQKSGTYQKLATLQFKE
ncbi:MAG: multidrug ABC transporter ATP-binding protein [Flavobacteriales bacterium]|nr:multidrug ABC transporter ATP-binding protein [Flavobacteriales bacterium]